MLLAPGYAPAGPHPPLPMGPWERSHPLLEQVRRLVCRPGGPFEDGADETAPRLQWQLRTGQWVSAWAGAVWTSELTGWMGYWLVDAQAVPWLRELDQDALVREELPMPGWRHGDHLYISDMALAETAPAGTGRALVRRAEAAHPWVRVVCGQRTKRGAVRRWGQCTVRQAHECRWQ